MKVKDAVPAKKQLENILLDISWARIARHYFNKSSSWIYNKLNGIDGNGGKGEFTDEEKEQLKNALYDLSDKLRRTADRLK